MNLGSVYLFIEIYWDFLYDLACDKFLWMFRMCWGKKCVLLRRILYIHISISSISLIAYSSFQCPCRFCLLKLPTIERGICTVRADLSISHYSSISFFLYIIQGYFISAYLHDKKFLVYWIILSLHSNSFHY